MSRELSWFINGMYWFRISYIKRNVFSLFQLLVVTGSWSSERHTYDASAGRDSPTSLTDELLSQLVKSLLGSPCFPACDDKGTHCHFKVVRCDIGVSRENIVLKTGNCSLTRSREHQLHILHMTPVTAACQWQGHLGPGSVLLPVVPAGPHHVLHFLILCHDWP